MIWPVYEKWIFLFGLFHHFESFFVVAGDPISLRASVDKRFRFGEMRLFLATGKNMSGWILDLKYGGGVDNISVRIIVIWPV